MTRLQVNVVREQGANLPVMSKPNSSGYDVFAFEDTILPPFKPTLVKVGFKMEFAPGFEAQVRPRSGLALKGITVLNTPGTIDASYRGDVGVIMFNTNPEPYEVKAGDRIAQLVFAKVEEALFVDKDTLSDTERGEGGFGHTGK